jgi:hypothetical protein
MIDPHYEVQKWIYDTLRNDTGVVAAMGGGIDVESRIWPEDVAPEGTAYPYITAVAQGGDQGAQTVQGRVVWFEIVEIVRATTDSEDISQIAPISAAIFTALNRKTGATDQARIISCAFDAPYRQYSEVDGEQLLSLGAFWRFQVQSLT